MFFGCGPKHENTSPKLGRTTRSSKAARSAKATSRREARASAKPLTGLVARVESKTHNDGRWMKSRGENRMS